VPFFEFLKKWSDERQGDRFLKEKSRNPVRDVPALHEYF